MCRPIETKQTTPAYDSSLFGDLPVIKGENVRVPKTLDITFPMDSNLLEPTKIEYGLTEAQEVEELQEILDFTASSEQDDIESGNAFDKEDIHILSNFLYQSDQSKPKIQNHTISFNEANSIDILELDFMNDSPIEMLRKILEPKQKGDRCGVNGCEHFSREGYRCIRHIQQKEQIKKENDSCGVEGCTNLIRRKGFCIFHAREIGSD